MHSRGTPNSSCMEVGSWKRRGEKKKRNAKKGEGAGLVSNCGNHFPMSALLLRCSAWEEKKKTVRGGREEGIAGPRHVIGQLFLRRECKERKKIN